MRIITGKAKGIKLTTLEGEATRPTSERAKEAVFSMIQFDIEGRRILDLFAGSGQMGLEAISRGAESAVLVDKSKQAIRIINDNIAKTRFNNEVTAFNCDYVEFLKSYTGPRFDIIFLDPPYQSGFYVTALEALFKHELLKPTSLILCESSDDNAFYDTDIIKEKYKVIKQNRYSRSLITILSLIQ